MRKAPTTRMLQLAMIVAAGLGHAACSAEQPGNAPASTVQSGPAQRDEAMEIRIRAGESVVKARLEDSAAARDFAMLLPLQLTLKDYASTEKVADLPRKLSTDDAPAGVDPEVGDIAYYAPWGNLAIYYRDFGYSRGLVRLGRIESGTQALASVEGPVTIEAVEQQRP